jgi:amino acid adenylation domain-containing protein
MNRSAEMVVALLGILKAGGPYVPLNFEHPPARLAHQLAETAAPVLVTEEALLQQLPEYRGAVVCVDHDRDEIERQPASEPPHEAEPENLVYVMYTSGSTGLPKGVAVTHRNLATYVTAVSRALSLDLAAPALAFAAVSAISTDLGNTSVFPSLLSGGTLHLVSPDVAMDGELLASYLELHAIDVLKITPSHFRAVSTACEPARLLPRRWLVLGGEALSWKLAADLLAVGSGCRILNHYGPTETTVGACVFEVETVPSSSPSRTVPIGRPLANSRAYVVDDHLRLLPPGVPGELCIGGDGVARGYVGPPAQSEQAFVPDPLSSAPGSRLYRTGDRARYLRDETLEFLGRFDDQVKIRGYRIEPGEIETVLRRHPSVQQAAVVARAEGDGELVLVAYVVASSALATEELQVFLKESLPAYMVPARIVALRELPLTPSGKIDRAALPEPGDHESTIEYVPPRTPLETGLARIWEEVLGLERVGVNDDFFALGGHSLLATQVVIRIRKAYRDIPVYSIFDAPTVADLAQIVEGGEEA